MEEDNFNRTDELRELNEIIQDLDSVLRERPEGRTGQMAIEHIYARLSNRTHSLQQGIKNQQENSNKAISFVKHVQNHLKPDEEVVCVICGKTINEIADVPESLT